MSNLPEHQILLVEVDGELADMVTDFLRPHGFHVHVEGNGDAAVERIINGTFDVIILDVNLPGMDGFSVCRTVRPKFGGPILILTARADEVDEVVGLEVGADDYMAKPVRPRALLARLRAHLRKTPSGSSTGAAVDIHDLRIDSGSRTVEHGGQRIDLTSAEFDLLWLLAERVGQVVSRIVISEQLNGVSYNGFDRSIDLRVSRLRKKLGDDSKDPTLIKSVRGVGYLLAADW